MGREVKTDWTHWPPRGWSAAPLIPDRPPASPGALARLALVLALGAGVVAVAVALIGRAG